MAAKRSKSALSAEERAAMAETIRERKRGAGNGEADVLEKIAAMPQPDRAIAERVHAIVKAAAPELLPRTWYGMPAYSKDGNVVCYFQNASKFKARYATLGFSDKASLDDGDMWPTVFAIDKMTSAVEARIVELVKKAIS